jgi:phosphoketolase
MKFRTGLWIDHKKCVIVLMTGDKIEKKIVFANAEKHQKSNDDKGFSDTYEFRKATSEDRKERQLMMDMNNYFDKIISYIQSAEFIFIFGPDETKSALLKRINMKKLAGHIEKIETAYSMTDLQIVAKVKDYAFI